MTHDKAIIYLSLIPKAFDLGEMPMNPNLTANLRAEAELKSQVRQQQLAEIRQKLAAAQPLLAEAIDLIHHNNLAPLFSEIYSDVADAHFYCIQAISGIDEHPQSDQ